MPKSNITALTIFKLFASVDAAMAEQFKPQCQAFAGQLTNVRWLNREIDAKQNQYLNQKDSIKKLAHASEALALADLMHELELKIGDTIYHEHIVSDDNEELSNQHARVKAMLAKLAIDSAIEWQTKIKFHMKAMSL